MTDQLFGWVWFCLGPFLEQCTKVLVLSALSRLTGWKHNDKLTCILIIVSPVFVFSAPVWQYFLYLTVVPVKHLVSPLSVKCYKNKMYLLTTICFIIIIIMDKWV